MKESYNKKYYLPTMEDLVGRVFTSVDADGDTLTFTDEKGEFTFWHDQDCCENVYIESIVGDLSDLENSPILLAEESTNDATSFEGRHYDSATWTFYKFATRKGYVDVRWIGISNGYYSECVSLRYKGEV